MNKHELHTLLDQCRHSRLNAWASGADHVPAPPFQVHINPTNICNNRCRMCPHDEVMRKDRGHMPLDLFKSIVDRMPQEIVRVYLLKQGEPLLNPNTPDMLAYLKSARPQVHVAVHTNGSVPLGERWKDVLENVDSLGVSLSAISPEVYRQVHGRGHFQTVLDNLKIIDGLLAPGELDAPPHVFIDYVRQPANDSENMDQVFEFHRRHFAHLSSVDFHPLFNWQGDIEDGGDDPDSYIDDDSYPCCLFPWSSMTVCHDGQVAYCQEESKENVFLGDLNREALGEAWNNDRYRAFRRRMASRDYDALMADGFFCKKCSYLFNHHSQSPQNLCRGWMGTAGTEVRFGNLLAEDAQAMLVYAANCYLSGELHKARGVLAHLEDTDCPEELMDARDELSALCRAVSLQYRGMYAVKQAMRRAGTRIRPNVYRKLSK